MRKPAERTAKEFAARVSRELPMIRDRVAGIDLGSRQMYVCGPVEQDGKRAVRSYETTTEAIQACVQWLRGMQVESVAMESTGVYWIPVLEIMEASGLEVLLVDTRPLSRVPGRKTDVIDCEWIQTLHSHGLLQGCFRPSEAISMLRNLTRQKAVLVAEQADWVRRMHKCLDQMNVRVHHAVSDTQGTTGMAIIRAIVKGERDPRKLAALRDAHCQKSAEQIAALLSGHWRGDHLFNLEQSLKIYDLLGERLAEYERQIQEQMKRLTPPDNEDRKAPAVRNPAKAKAIKRRNQEEKRQRLYRLAGADLTAIDAVNVETVEVLLSEYGPDLSQFESEKQFVAHLQLVPRKPVSGGKPLKKRARKTKSTRTGQALRMAAVTLSRSSSALGAYFRRICRTKDGSVAVFATARKLATLIYRMLRWGQQYIDIGQQAYEELYQKARIRSLTTTAAQFGYEITKKTEAVTA
jgi:transposase